MGIRYLKKILNYIFFILFLLFTPLSNKNKIYAIQIRTVALNTPDDIIPINDSLVIPASYTKTISLKNLSVDKKKLKFAELILPGILITKYKLKQDENFVKNIYEKTSANKELRSKDSIKLKKLFKEYYTTDLSDLLLRLKTHPTSIVMAQAAIESGWGTSKFFVKANNIFGVWANENSESKVRTISTRNGKIIYVKAYQNLSSSIEDYFKTLATTKAYHQFRKKRALISNPYLLSSSLNRYSEQGTYYTKKIKTIIKENNLTKYDNYRINPAYIKPVSILEE